MHVIRTAVACLGEGCSADRHNPLSSHPKQDLRDSNGAFLRKETNAEQKTKSSTQECRRPLFRTPDVCRPVDGAG